MYSLRFTGRRWLAAAGLAILVAALTAAGCTGATPDNSGGGTGGSTGGGTTGGGAPPADTPAPVSTAMPPAAPSDLTGDVVAVFDVPVGWKDNASNEDGFNVYRQRIDVLSTKQKAGESGKDSTRFLDKDTFCGATYQYTVASFNNAGESPATTCWQITLPQCPFPSNVRLKGGDVTNPGDFYLTAGGSTLMADLPGQNGLVDLGDVGDLPLHHVTLPAPADYKKDGVATVAGHTYAALLKDGQSVMVFTIKTLENKTAETIGIIWRPGKTITGACTPLVNAIPGGVCVSNDGVCDPTCTGGKDADCGGNQCVSGDGVCVADCGGSATGGGITLVSNTGSPVDQGCQTCTTTYYKTDTDCSEGKSWSDTTCQPNTNVVCQPPCPPNDPACGKQPDCDPATDPNKCVTTTPCPPGSVTSPNGQCTPLCNPQTDPNHCGTQPPCPPGTAASANGQCTPQCDPATDPNKCLTTTPCPPGTAASANGVCTPQCDPATGANCGTQPPTEPPGVCQEGWWPVGQCVCCGSDRVCPTHIEKNHSDCQEATRPPRETCTCVQGAGAAANFWFCKENPNQSCHP